MKEREGKTYLTCAFERLVLGGKVMNENSKEEGGNREENKDKIKKKKVVKGGEKEVKTRDYFSSRASRSAMRFAANCKRSLLRLWKFFRSSDSFASIKSIGHEVSPPGREQE